MRKNKTTFYFSLSLRDLNKSPNLINLLPISIDNNKIIDSFKPIREAIDRSPPETYYLLSPRMRIADIITGSKHVLILIRHSLQATLTAAHSPPPRKSHATRFVNGIGNTTTQRLSIEPKSL